jgi:hypothetical protein
LWKATKKIKQVKKPPPLRTSQGTWANSTVEKVHAFAEHLAKDFQPHPSENEHEEEEELIQLLKATYQLEPPINRLRRPEVQDAISSLNPRKPSGYNFIRVKILKEMPLIGIKYLTQLFNTVLFKGYFPAQWKVAQTILVLKPGKPPSIVYGTRKMECKVYETRKIVYNVYGTRKMVCKVYGTRKMVCKVYGTRKIACKVYGTR